VYKIVNIEDFSKSKIANWGDLSVDGVIEHKDVNVNEPLMKEFISTFNNKIYVSYDIIKEHPFNELIQEQGKGSFATNYNHIKDILKLEFPKFKNEIEYI